MTEPTSYRSGRQANRLAFGPLIGLLATMLLLAPAPDSTAQVPQDNRQLNRAQAQQSSSALERRIALVIGNGTYSNASPLKNPPNDARDMTTTLRELGFVVTSGINVNQREMKRLIREFGQSLRAGGSGLFYYAGHGVQSKGRNYLIPIDADIQSEAEVEDSGVDVSLVLNYMDDARNGLNMVILDACRNNPFARSFRSASDGLAQVDAPTGTLIAYATAPGRVASDGTGQNGLYTSELLKQMRVPRLSATEVFMRVRVAVMNQTDNKQVPWEASSLVGTFYFRAPGESAAKPPDGVAVNEPRIDPSAFELSYWETIKNSTNVEDFKAYLERYPKGQFASLAKIRITAFGTIGSAAKETGGTTAAVFFPINVSVRADAVNAGWTNAGLVIRRGQHLRITASGRISLGSGIYSTPAGVTNLTDGDKLMRSEPTGGLIAVIGDDNDDFIFIGDRQDIVAARDGLLFLGVNESKLGDNSGVFTARLEAEAVLDVSVNTGNYPEPPKPTRKGDAPSTGESGSPLQRGYRTGYSDGYQAGLLDSGKQLPRAYWNKEHYLRADRFFNFQWGSLESFRDGYQQGFEAGYETGYQRSVFVNVVPSGLTRRGTVP